MTSKYYPIIQDLELRIRLCKEKNDEILTKRSEYNELHTRVQRLEEWLGRLKHMKLVMTIAMNKFRNTVTSRIEQDISNALALTFPDEDYRVKIKNDTRDGEPQSVLLIGKEIDNEVIWSPPALANGGLAKQIIAFSGVQSILALKGIKTIYTDEGFNSGDGKSLQELEPYFQKLYADGIQILGIEHKPDVYKHLPHRIITMMKNRTTGGVSVMSVEDNNMQSLDNLGLIEQLKQLPDLQTSGTDGIDTSVFESLSPTYAADN